MAAGTNVPSQLLLAIVDAHDTPQQIEHLDPAALQSLHEGGNPLLGRIMTQGFQYIPESGRVAANQPAENRNPVPEISEIAGAEQPSSRFAEVEHEQASP